MSVSTTTMALGALAGLAAIGGARGVVSLRRPPEARGSAKWEVVVAMGVGGVSVLLLVGRALAHQGWRPLETHVDALLLVAAGLAAAIGFLLVRPRFYAVAAFAFPVLSLVLVLAACPTMIAPRTHESAWLVLHLLTVLGGVVLSALAAAVGAAWLHTQRRLKDRAHLKWIGRTLSLETLENYLVALSTAGFLAFSAGLATGIIYGVQKNAMHWGSPKVVASLGAWALYALLMNVRHAGAVRGRYAAWLAIIGLVLVVVAYALSLPAAAAGVTP